LFINPREVDAGRLRLLQLDPTTVKALRAASGLTRERLEAAYAYLLAYPLLSLTVLRQGDEFPAGDHRPGGRISGAAPECAKLRAPLVDRLVAGDDPALGEEILNTTKAEMESKVSTIAPFAVRSEPMTP
jgi:hypothetical protein